MTVEERLTRALEHRAESTTVSPDGWDRIEERVAGRQHRQRTVRWTVGPALALAALAAVLAVVASGKDDPQVTAGSAAYHYAPQGLDGRYVLRFVETQPVQAPPAGFSQHVYARSSADPATAGAAIEVTVWTGTGGPPKPLDIPAEYRATVRGLPAQVTPSPDGANAQWVDAAGATVTLQGHRLNRDELLAFAEALQIGPEGPTGTLPQGFVESAGAPEFTAERITSELWVRPDQSRPGETVNNGFTLSQYDGAALTLDSTLSRLSSAERASLGGVPALVDAAGSAIAWMPRPGVLLVLRAEGSRAEKGPPPAVSGARLSEAELRDLAAHVRELDDGAWGHLARSATQDPSQPVTIEQHRGQLVASGGTTHPDRRWDAYAFLQDGHVCVEFASGGDTETSCGTGTGPGGFGTAKLATPFVWAAVGKDVAEVRVVFDGADPVVTRPVEAAGLPVNVVVFAVPPGATATEIVSIDAAGKVVSRSPLVPTPTKG